MKCNASTLNDTVQFGSFNKSWLSDNLFIALNNSQQYKSNLKGHKMKTSNIFHAFTLYYIRQLPMMNPHSSPVSLVDPDLVSVSLMTLEILRHSRDHEEDLSLAVRDLDPHTARGGGGHDQGVILVILNIAIHHHNSG